MYGQDGDVAELKYFMKCDMNYYMRRTSHEMHVGVFNPDIGSV